MRPTDIAGPSGPALPCLIAFLACLTVSPAAAEPGNVPAIRIDTRAAWHKRDNADCRSAARLSLDEDAVVLVGDTTGVLFWRIPTISGRAMILTPTPDWIRRCRRPPLEFGSGLVDGKQERRLMVDVSRYPRFRWRWRVDRLARPGGPRERRTSARIGLNVISKSGELHEISYVWADSVGADSVFVHRTEHAGGMVKRDWHRFVVRSGEDDLGAWVSESRNFHEDFRRLFPKETPGYVIRLYLRADGDGGGPVTAAFSDIVFTAEDRID